MSEQEHRVACIMDPEFGDHLIVLVGRMGVWVCDSPTNRRAAEVARRTIWNSSIEHEVTTFNYSTVDSPEDVFVEILESIELHHGQLSHDPPWTALEVYGARPTLEVRAALRDYGVKDVETTDRGFVAFRGYRE